MSPRVLKETVEGSPREVETGILFAHGQARDYAKALRIAFEGVGEAALALRLKRLFGDVTERGVAEVVSQAARFDRIRIECFNESCRGARYLSLIGELAKPLGVAPTDLCNLQRVAEAIVEGVA